MSEGEDIEVLINLFFDHKRPQPNGETDADADADDQESTARNE